MNHYFFIEGPGRESNCRHWLWCQRYCRWVAWKIVYLWKHYCLTGHFSLFCLSLESDSNT